MESELNMQTEKFPKSVTVLMTFSALVCLPMVVLSMVNYGMLSIWLNATVAFLVLIHHISFGIAAWTRRKHLADISKAVMLVTSVEEFSALMTPPPIAYEVWNILSLGFLFILNSTAFGIMVDITTRGAMKSTLPAERIGSHKWNIKIQIGQTSVLGTEVLLLASMLVVCFLGRRRVMEAQENIQEEIDYDMMESPLKANS